MNEDKGSGSTPPEEEPRTVKPGQEGGNAGANPDEERTVVAPAAPEEEERTVVAPSAAAGQPAMPAGATSMSTFGSRPAPTVRASRSATSSTTSSR
jgi:hypothetical protein